MNDINPRTSCRLCGRANLERVWSLEPLSDVFLCRTCGHAQVLDVSVRLEKNPPGSESKPKSAAYIQDYADDIMARYRLPSGGQVVEIGSNDGALLRTLQEKSCRVLGVDSARDIAIKAWESGIDTLPRFFTAELARDTILEQRGSAVMVIANDVLAGIDDLSDFLNGVRILLTPGGLFVFEVSYLVDVFEKALLDALNRDQLSYFTVKPLLPFLHTHGFELIEALRTDANGGSLRAIAKVVGGPWPIGSSIAAAIALEDRLGVHAPEAFNAFAARKDAALADRGQIITITVE